MLLSPESKKKRVTSEGEINPLGNRNSSPLRRMLKNALTLSFVHRIIRTFPPTTTAGTEEKRGARERSFLLDVRNQIVITRTVRTTSAVSRTESKKRGLSLCLWNTHTLKKGEKSVLPLFPEVWRERDQEEEERKKEREILSPDQHPNPSKPLTTTCTKTWIGFNICVLYQTCLGGKRSRKLEPRDGQPFEEGSPFAKTCSKKKLQV